MNKFKLFVGIAFTLLLHTTIQVNAQPGDPPTTPDDPVPLSGIEILLIAGGALGGYKLFGKRSSSDNK